MDERSPHWPLVCAPEEKAQREAQNAVNQIDFITHLVMERKVRELRESHILELQGLAVEGIYPCGRTYRDARDEVKISDSEHKPAHAADVRNFVTELVEWVNRSRAEGQHEIACASYALWRLNWIHPFRGGNGRTSRMIAYLIICIAMEQMLPGTPSIPAQIYDRRHEYLAALRAIDADLRMQHSTNVEEPKPNVQAMIDFLQPLIEFQLERGVSHGEMLERMFQVLADGTGRVELNVENPISMPGAENLGLLAELDDARNASIQSGHRVARLFLNANAHVHAIAPKNHDGETGVSREHALALLEAGAVWAGHDHHHPAHGAVSTPL